MPLASFALAGCCEQTAGRKKWHFAACTEVRATYNGAASRARVAELVDAADSKSVAL